MSQTFSNFKNSFNNPFRDMSSEMMYKRRADSNRKDPESGDFIVGAHQKDKYLTNLEKQANLLLPENIKAHNVQRQHIIKKNSSHFFNSLAQPSATDYANMALANALSGQSSDGRESSRNWAAALDDQQ